MPSLFLQIKSLDDFGGVDLSPVLDGTFIDILSFQHGVALPVMNRRSMGATSGMRRGTCEHGDFVIQRLTDNISPVFFRACAAGAVFEGVAVHVCRHNVSGGETEFLPHLSIYMSDVLISSFNYQCDEDLPMETIAFAYGSINWNFKPLDPEEFESVKGKFEAGWDGSKNKSAAEETIKSLMGSLKIPDSSGGLL